MKERTGQASISMTAIILRIDFQITIGGAVRRSQATGREGYLFKKWYHRTPRRMLRRISHTKPKIYNISRLFSGRRSEATAPVLSGDIHAESSRTIADDSEDDDSDQDRSS